jgi:hypothetical protein
MSDAANPPRSPRPAPRSRLQPPARGPTGGRRRSARPSTIGRTTGPRRARSSTATATSATRVDGAVEALQHPLLEHRDLGPVVYSQAPTPDIRRRFQDKDDTAGWPPRSCSAPRSIPARPTTSTASSSGASRLPAARLCRGPRHLQAPPSRATAHLPGGRERVRAVGPLRDVPHAHLRTGVVGRGCRRPHEGRSAGAVRRRRRRALLLPPSRTRTRRARSLRDRACIWEIWCKRGRVRFFLAEGYPGWLKAPEPDPLRLENFYPWPKPIWSITTNESMIPTRNTSSTRTRRSSSTT